MLRMSQVGWRGGVRYLGQWPKYVFYTCPLQERGSTDGHFLFLQTSNLLFLIGTENAMGGCGVFGCVCHLVLYEPSHNITELCGRQEKLCFNEK